MQPRQALETIFRNNDMAVAMWSFVQGCLYISGNGVDVQRVIRAWADRHGILDDETTLRRRYDRINAAHTQALKSDPHGQA